MAFQHFPRMTRAASRRYRQAYRCPPPSAAPPHVCRRRLPRCRPTRSVSMRFYCRLRWRAAGNTLPESAAYAALTTMSPLYFDETRFQYRCRLPPPGRALEPAFACSIQMLPRRFTGGLEVFPADSRSRSQYAAPCGPPFYHRY